MYVVNFKVGFSVNPSLHFLLLLDLTVHHFYSTNKATVILYCTSKGSCKAETIHIVPQSIDSDRARANTIWKFGFQ